MAKESAEKKAKDDYKEYFTIEPENDIPAYMKSQISGKVFDREQMVISSSGVLYDKNELNRYISSRKSPCCIVTGKNLKEVINEKHEDDFNCDDNFDISYYYQNSIHSKLQTIIGIHLLLETLQSLETPKYKKANRQS